MKEYLFRWEGNGGCCYEDYIEAETKEEAISYFKESHEYMNFECIETT